MKTLGYLIRSGLIVFLGWALRRLESGFSSSSSSSLRVMDATLNIGVDPTPLITAGITAAGEIIKLTTTELAALNSPAAIQGRKNVALQADRDRADQDAASALKSGNASEVNKDLA